MSTEHERLEAAAEKLEEYIEDCTDNFGDGDESYYPWQNNVLATDVVVHPGGRFARDEDEAPGELQLEDLDLCERVRGKLADLASGKLVWMRSEGDDPWFPFVSLACVDETQTAPTEAWVRERLFGGAFCPHDIVKLEPLAPGCAFLKDALEDAGHDALSEEDWAQVIELLSSNGFSNPVGIYAGLFEYDAKPSGIGIRGSILLRIACGQTANGSIVGLMGRVTWT